MKQATKNRAPVKGQLYPLADSVEGHPRRKAKFRVKVTGERRRAKPGEWVVSSVNGSREGYRIREATRTAYYIGELVPLVADDFLRDYNGWENFETFTLSNYLDGSQLMQERCQECARLYFRDATKTDVLTRSQSARFTFTDYLKDKFRERAEDIERLKRNGTDICRMLFPRDNEETDQPQLFASLADIALCEVNWEEIADHFLATVKGYERA